MASFRKKYAETSPRQDVPVTVPPTGAAKLPEPVEAKIAGCLCRSPVALTAERTEIS
jgi:hypothetical protein